MRRIATVGPLSLWERVRVRARRNKSFDSECLQFQGILGPHPRPLSQRERGEFSQWHLVTLAFIAFTCLAATFAGPASAAAPADRVVAIYFHRTQRCPTCKKMGSYSEEAIKKGFAKESKAGKVEFHYVDFQDPKNAAFTKAYRVSGPALVVAKVVNKKVKEFKDLKDIWSNVRKKPAFIKYVQDNVTAYLK